MKQFVTAVDNYNKTFGQKGGKQRPKIYFCPTEDNDYDDPDLPLDFSEGWMSGTWMIGSCYKNPNNLYGAYPHSYLDRVHSMFPNAKNILHIFSGGMTLEYAMQEAEKHCSDIETMELVDLHGPELGRYPTWQGDLYKMPKEWYDKFDLILADPPYSKEDAIKYGTDMINRAKVFRHLHKYCKKGGNLVWLDQVWPMHRKAEWYCWGHVMLIRSTNHRVRAVSFFEKI